MANPVIQASFTSGEVAPNLFGRVDLQRYHAGASTMRNMFPSYRGGAYSRAGTAYVGMSKQTGRSYPPRLIPFQFSINQGLILEFGNQYMRVIQNGAYVLESSTWGISAASVAAQCQLTYSSPKYLTSVSPIISAVSASYAPGDTVTLAGGTSTVPAVVTVGQTTIKSLAVTNGGTGYTVGEYLYLNGGTQTSQPIVQVSSAPGGVITGITVTSAGSFTANPASSLFTSISTAYPFGGNGATFTAVLAPLSLSITTPGTYTVTPSNPVAQASTSGTGVGMTMTAGWTTSSALSNGDWIYITGVGGMTQLNGGVYVVTAATGTTVKLNDAFGNAINSSAFSTYTSGGSIQRIYTLASPYGEQDLPYLKFTQSANVMSLCCVNQQTLTEYQPYDLSRIANNSWLFSSVAPSEVVQPPTNVAVTSSNAPASGGSGSYSYVVTSVAADGTESVASTAAAITNTTNMSTSAASMTVTWTAVPNISQYNVYRTIVTANGAGLGAVASAPGQSYGFVGSVYGTSFIDSNIVPDFAQVPPLHRNPFARGQILGGTITTPSTGGSYTVSITTSTGTGANVQAFTTGASSGLQGFQVVNPGQNYVPADAFSFAPAGPVATLNVGPNSGTYPSVVAYFQQRRVYANSLNSTDTYWMSQPGSYLNFDYRIPTISSDAIIGTPWAVQVNGIQWLVPMPNGLVTFTGLGAWQLSGGSNGAAITPSSQSAQPQAYNGCSPTVPPIKIDYDIIYVQAKGSIYRDLSYNFFTSIYTGADLTVTSSHLFSGFTIKEHTWAEEPYKVLWSVRSDGTLLSMTFLKQEISGVANINAWARHDTDGLFQSIASITEPPVDAVYIAVQRDFGANRGYCVERMDNRLWSTAENCWCLDCAVQLAQPSPAANITISSPVGAGTITGFSGLVGGTKYSSATTAKIVDNNGIGPGAGATATLTIAAGIITNITIGGGGGSGYVNPQLVIYDPSNAGSGASAKLTLSNSATVIADASVFSSGDASNGAVIRANGGKAVITAYTSATQVTVNILVPFTSPETSNDPADLVRVTSGNWTKTTPVSSITNLFLFVGETLTVTYDGLYTTATVPSTGTITLPQAASDVLIGRPFTPQLQTIYLDAGEPTQQGRRKKIAAVTVRMESTYGTQIGGNQPDGSVQNPMQIAPAWTNMTPVPNNAVQPYNSVTPTLFTGDARAPITVGFDIEGQIALQQTGPYPMNILALIPEVLSGDIPEQTAESRRRGGGDE